MHVSPAKHSFGKCDIGKCDRLTDRQTDGRTADKVIPMCRYALQATQIENTLIYAHHISYKKISGIFALSLDPIIIQKWMKKEY